MLAHFFWSVTVEFFPWYKIAWRLSTYPLYIVTRILFVAACALISLDKRVALKAWEATA